MARPVLQLAVLVLLIGAARKETAAEGITSVQPAECNHTCGNLSIPYPFGIGDGGYEKDYGNFNIACDQSKHPSMAILSNSNMEVLDINLTTGELRVTVPIGYECCEGPGGRNETHNQWLWLDKNSPYTFSHTRNRFFTVGCDATGIIVGRRDEGDYTSGCTAQPAI